MLALKEWTARRRNTPIARPKQKPASRFLSKLMLTKPEARAHQSPTTRPTTSRFHSNWPHLWRFWCRKSRVWQTYAPRRPFHINPILARPFVSLVRSIAAQVVCRTVKPSPFSCHYCDCLPRAKPSSFVSTNRRALINDGSSVLSAESTSN